MPVQGPDSEASRNISGKLDSPTCFLHIPKSAGSSILASLEGVLPPGSMASCRCDTSIFCDFHDFELLRPEARANIAANLREVQALAKYRAVCGHFSLPTLLRITKASSIATILREPRARLLSLYTFWRTPGIGDPLAPYRVTEHAFRPLQEFLSEPRLAAAIDNQMCRMLLHGDSRLPEAGFAALSDIDAIVGEAIKRLDGLGFVGMLELGDMAWEGVGRLFGVTLKHSRVNVTGQYLSVVGPGSESNPFSPEAVTLIEQRSAADMLVYDHALTRAGLDARERQLLKDGAFAQQLVKLGDLVGHSAAQAAEQAGVVEMLRRQLEEREQSHAELDVFRKRMHVHERTVQTLREEIGRRDENVDRLRRWLDAVHSSASWRLTAPLRAVKHGIGGLWSAHGGSAMPAREQSLLAGRSVSQVWWFALVLSATIAATDAILSHVILIALLAVGPFCGLLTGRWAKTATAGAWAVVLAVLLGFPDEIWDTSTQLIDVGTVAAVALLSTFAAVLLESRRYDRRR